MEEHKIRFVAEALKQWKNEGTTRALCEMVLFLNNLTYDQVEKLSLVEVIELLKNNISNNTPEKISDDITDSDFDKHVTPLSIKEQIKTYQKKGRATTK